MRGEAWEQETTPAPHPGLPNVPRGLRCDEPLAQVGLALLVPTSSPRRLHVPTGIDRDGFPDVHVPTSSHRLVHVPTSMCRNFDTYWSVRAVLGCKTWPMAPADDNTTSALEVLRRADHVRQPWKNGGGVTYEVARDQGDDARFGWRLSFAEVNAPGPFSVFPGIDRIITLVEGNPMTLRVTPAVPKTPSASAGAKPKTLRVTPAMSKTPSALGDGHPRARRVHPMAPSTPPVPSAPGASSRSESLAANASTNDATSVPGASAGAGTSASVAPVGGGPSATDAPTRSGIPATETSATFEHVLHQGQPFAFSGEDAVVATPAGRTLDFNVMVDRDRYAAHVEPLPPGATIVSMHPSEHCMVVCLAGSVTLANKSIVTLKRLDVAFIPGPTRVSGAGEALVVRIESV